MTTKTEAELRTYRLEYQRGYRGTASYREAQRRYKAKNRDTINEKANARRAANPEKLREINRLSMRKLTAADPEKYRRISAESHKRRYKAKPAIFRAYAVKRHAKMACPGWADTFIISEMYDLARRRTLSTGIRWEVDHIVPLQSRIVCGLHTDSNLRVIPSASNKAKGNLFWPGHPDPSRSMSLSNSFH